MDDIYEQAKSEEWVRVQTTTHARLELEKETILVIGQFANEHDARLAVLKAYCAGNPEMSALELLHFIQEHLERVVVE